MHFRSTIDTRRRRTRRIQFIIRTSVFTNILVQETIDIAINLVFNHNLNLNITRKELKNLFLFATSQIILFSTVSVIIKSME